MSIFVKIILVLIMTLSGSMGAYFFKLGIGRMSGLNILKMILIPQIWIGGMFYIVGILSNVFLLRYMNYTVLYPMTSLTYVWTLLVSYFVLKEKMNYKKIIAISLIIAGIIIINI